MSINKISGGSPTVPTAAAEETAAPEKAKSGDFAAKVDKTEAPAEAAAPSTAREAAPTTYGRMTGDIAEKLDRKEITADAAVDQVMSRVLDRQLGANSTPTARAQVESALRNALENDPVLASKVKSLAD